MAKDLKTLLSVCFLSQQSSLRPPACNTIQEQSDVLHTHLAVFFLRLLPEKSTMYVCACVHVCLWWWWWWGVVSFYIIHPSIMTASWTLEPEAASKLYKAMQLQQGKVKGEGGGDGCMVARN